MKNGRISGCFHDIKVHPIQNLHSSHSSGTLIKLSSGNHFISQQLCVLYAVKMLDGYSVSQILFSDLL